MKLSVKRQPDTTQTIVESVAAPVPVAAAPAPAPVAAAPAAAAPAEAAPRGGDTGNYVEVKSPMIGTFYRSANPDSPAFVSVGDKIEAGLNRMYHRSDETLQRD